MCLSTDRPPTPESNTPTAIAAFVSVRTLRAERLIACDSSPPKRPAATKPVVHGTVVAYVLQPSFVGRIGAERRRSGRQTAHRRCSHEDVSICGNGHVRAGRGRRGAASHSTARGAPRRA